MRGPWTSHSQLQMDGSIKSDLPKKTFNNSSPCVEPWPESNQRRSYGGPRMWPSVADGFNVTREQSASFSLLLRRLLAEVSWGLQYLISVGKETVIVPDGTHEPHIQLFGRKYYALDSLCSVLFGSFNSQFIIELALVGCTLLLKSFILLCSLNAIHVR